jgi:hypothetical protein
MTNPMSWAIYLSVGIEIAALSALAGLAVKNNKAIYLPFIIVTFIQLIGNMFFVFQYVDVTSKLFKDWVILVDPLFSMLSMVDTGDIDGHRRWLAAFAGALLPIISLSFLHLLVNFNDKEGDELKVETTDPIPFPETPINDEPKGVSSDIEEIDYFNDENIMNLLQPEPGFSSTGKRIFKVPVGKMSEDEAKEIAREFINDIKEVEPVNEDFFIPVKQTEEIIEEPVISDDVIDVVDEVSTDVVDEEPVISGNEVVTDSVTPHQNIKSTPVNNNQIMRVGPHNEKKTIFFRDK